MKLHTCNADHYYQEKDSKGIGLSSFPLIPSKTAAGAEAFLEGD